MSDRLKSLLDGSLITVLTEVVESCDLLLTYGSVIDFENIDRIFLLEAILINPYDDLLTRVDTSLSTSCSLFDTHLR